MSCNREFKDYAVIELKTKKKKKKDQSKRKDDSEEEDAVPMSSSSKSVNAKLAKSSGKSNGKGGGKKKKYEESEEESQSENESTDVSDDGQTTDDEEYDDDDDGSESDASGSTDTSDSEPSNAASGAKGASAGAVASSSSSAKTAEGNTAQGNGNQQQQQQQQHKQPNTANGTGANGDVAHPKKPWQKRKLVIHFSGSAMYYAQNDEASVWTWDKSGIKFPVPDDQLGKWGLGGIHLIGFNNSSPFNIGVSIPYDTDERMDNDREYGLCETGCLIQGIDETLQKTSIVPLPPNKSDMRPPTLLNSVPIATVRREPPTLFSSFLNTREFRKYTVKNLTTLNIGKYPGDDTLVNVNTSHPIIQWVIKRKHLRDKFNRGGNGNLNETYRTINREAKAGQCTLSKKEIDNLAAQIIKTETRNITLESFKKNFSVKIYRSFVDAVGHVAGKDDADSSASKRDRGSSQSLMSGANRGEGKISKATSNNNWDSPADIMHLLSPEELANPERRSRAIAGVLTTEICVTLTFMITMSPLPN